MAAAPAAPAAPGHSKRINPPTFSGEGPQMEVAETVNTFIELFEAFCESQNYAEDAEKLGLLRHCFQPVPCEASRWFSVTKREPGKATDTWAEVKALLLQRFDIPKTANQLASLRASLVQQPKESVRAFADRVMSVQFELNKHRETVNIPTLNAAQRTAAVNGFSNSDAAINYLAGLKPGIRRVVNQAVPGTTFDDWVAIAARAETAEHESGRPSDHSGAHAASVDAIQQNRGQAQGGQGQRNQRNYGNQQQGGGYQRQGQQGGPTNQGNQQNRPPTKRPGWIRFADIPPNMCLTCGYEGHRSSQCTTQYERQRWGSVIKQLGLRPPPGQGGQRQGQYAVSGQQQSEQQQPNTQNSQPANQQPNPVPTPPPRQQSTQPPPAQAGQGAYAVGGAAFDGSFRDFQ